MRTQLPAGKNVAFSLIEIMTVVIIISLLITAAIPGYENFVRNNQAFVISSRLESSLRLAQAEAIKRGVPVTICPIEDFNPTASLNQSSEQYPCADTTTWNAWKVFVDPNFDAEEDYTDGWPIISYVGGDIPTDSVNSNVSGPITYDPLGFANVNPTITRAGWTWSDNFNSGEWEWSYSYNSEYTGDYANRLFTIVPNGCSGNNARLVEVSQNGVITITNTTCYGI